MAGMILDNPCSDDCPQAACPRGMWGGSHEENMSTQSSSFHKHAETQDTATALASSGRGEADKPAEVAEASTLPPNHSKSTQSLPKIGGDRSAETHA